jgi:hypothetical protein
MDPPTRSHASTLEKKLARLPQRIENTSCFLVIRPKYLIDHCHSFGQVSALQGIGDLRSNRYEMVALFLNEQKAWNWDAVCLARFKL